MIKMNWGPVLTWSIDNHGLMKSVWGGLASALQMIDDFDTSDTEGSSMGRLQVWGLYGMANFNPYDEHSPSVCKTYFFTRQTPNCTPWSGLGQGQKLFLSINQIIVLLKSSPYHMTFMNISLLQMFGFMTYVWSGILYDMLSWLEGIKRDLLIGVEVQNVNDFLLPKRGDILCIPCTYTHP